MTRRLQRLIGRMVVAHRTNGEPYPADRNPFHPSQWPVRPRTVSLRQAGPFEPVRITPMEG